MGKSKSNFYEELGRELCKAFSKQLSHPYVKVDMCPDFDNLLILTFGRFVYKAMLSKKIKKLWKETNFKTPLDGLRKGEHINISMKGMKNCCTAFFESEGLQGVLDIPMQFCPYCRHKLTDKEFEHFNKKGGK